MLLVTAVSVIKDSHLILSYIVLISSHPCLTGCEDKEDKERPYFILHTSPYPRPRLGSGFFMPRREHRVSHECLDADTRNVNPA
ncbi:uncharacterized protein EURHEDRAFT_412761 [Aspergillus ruber CBS 135680]|uniref:Uncharacterized protein n=1 Tax=Aspergillus ruber (strain CBS 135680) TaxID=1388766 RepID=A0A017SD04_ASPRC|nr:uncharacterized protein EURHEDRAFT_412761 [Aspergillus ruber CBS 135680]EYE94918.1 hypothetical protein EURHEDRAFT_412761 [Aspergillus ruber CBS 135680]